MLGCIERGEQPCEIHCFLSATGRHGRGHHLDPAYPIVTVSEYGEPQAWFLECGGGENEITTEMDILEVLRVSSVLLKIGGLLIEAEFLKDHEPAMARKLLTMAKERKEYFEECIAR